jgi:hypothetical protein
MRFNTNALFWAVAVVSAASYVICAAFVAVVPGATSQLFGWVMHIDLSSLARRITWGSSEA